ncbi:MAG: hypothetical protein HYY96_09655 [Candidatus Tectomicrobia bacterium]|nr:hypothetical protein [Candidatus Tectomicrobia bacterium]
MDIEPRHRSWSQDASSPEVRSQATPVPGANSAAGRLSRLLRACGGGRAKVLARTLLAASLLSALGGCALLPPEAPRPAPPLALYGADELVAILERRARLVRDLRGVAHLTLELGTQRFQAKQAVLIRLPAMLRIETLGLFGQSMFLFTSDSRELRIFYPRERKYYLAQATRKNLSRLLGLSLSITSLATLSSGGVPLPRLVSGAGVQAVPSLRLQVLSFPTPAAGRQEVWFDTSATPTRVLRYDAAGRLILLAAFADFREVTLGPQPSSSGGASASSSATALGGERGETGAATAAPGAPRDTPSAGAAGAATTLRFPHEIEIVMPQDGAFLRLRYEEPEFNVGLDQAAFAFPPPPGAEVIRLDEAS